MYFQQVILAALAAAELTAAAAVSTSKGFSVKQVDSGKRKFRSGPMAVEATYLKYGKQVPDNVKKAAAAAQSGSVTATPEQYDRSYLCPVEVGTPAQTLMMDFDTGSSDLWVFSSEQSKASRKGHSFYKPKKSSTAKLVSGATWKIGYGDGSGAGGNVYADKVVIASVTATSQAVEAATSVSGQFRSDKQNDGLVGLAFDSINSAKPQVPTFVNNVQSSLAQPLFAASLSHNAAGSYDFGFIDTTKYTGSLTYVPVNNEHGFWEFVTTGYSVGSTSHTANLDTIADTGTSLIYLPSAVLKAYYSQVSGAKVNSEVGGYTFPCDATLPDLGLKIGGVTHTVPGDYINYAPVDSTTCFGGLQNSHGIGFNILGDVFLASQYVVFDVGNTQIGFAQAA